MNLGSAVATVAVLNLVYFGIEFSVALAIGSVSLFADSVDFLEDASVNFLILAALGWSAMNRARVGRSLAVVLLVPALAGLGAVAELVGIEGGVVSGVTNLESSGVEPSDWRPRHDEPYHEA